MKQIIMLLSAAMALVACGKAENEQQESAPEKKVMVLKEKPCEMTFQFPAQLKGKKDIAIIPEVSALLDEVLVKEGEQVKEGQRMFVLAQTAYRAALETAVAAMQKADAAVRTAQMEVDAKKQLLDKAIISDHEYQVANNQLLMAKAQLSEAKAQVTAARNDLSHTVICAPCDGIVGNINHRQGSLVGPSITTPLTIVSDNSQVYAYISINEKAYLNLVNYTGTKDSMIAALPEAELILSNGTVYEEKGTTETISGIIDPTTGAISIRIAFDNSKGKLFAGGSGTICFRASEIGIAIPRSASYEIQNKSYVYKVVKDGDNYVAQSTMVDVERLNETEYIVYSGLKAGDTIVLEGVRKMSNGETLTPETIDN